MKQKIFKICLYASLVSIILLAGFYLRHYFVLNGYIDSSPYEMIVLEDYDHNSTDDVINFTDKSNRYNFSYIVSQILPESIRDFYWIFIGLGSALFYLAYLISGSYIGGLVAVAFFSVAGENLIFYTREIGSSGLSYLLITLFLIFIYKFFKKDSNLFAVSAFGFFILNIYTYHNGASAGLIIFASILLSAYLEFFIKKIKKQNSLVTGNQILKPSVLFLFGLVFYLNHVFVYDTHQLTEIFSLVNSIWPLAMLVIFLLTLFLLFKFSRFIEKYFIVFYGLIIFISIFLVLYPSYFFDLFSYIPIWNYYVSPVTLNNYIAQILLINFVCLIYIQQFFKPNKIELVFLRGWLISILLIFSAFFLKGYYVRFLDYSIPFMSILFALYISKNIKNKKVLIVFVVTITILFCSQIVIFRDPFSMRRYYNVDEFVAAKEISKYLTDDNFIFSDLRTSAIFSAVGQTNVSYSVEDDLLHDIFFYHPYYIDETHLEFFIVSDNMQDILYSANFPTTPLTEEDFKFYSVNFVLVDYKPPFYLYNLKHE